MSQSTKMKIALVNPNVVTQKGDFLGSGIPYMPVSLAYLSAYLLQKGYEITVIDAFGEKPKQVREEEGLLVQGLSYEEIVHRLPTPLDAVIVYASSIMSYEIILRIIRSIRKSFRNPIIMAENSQSVTSFSLQQCYHGMIDAGADFVVMGDLEERMDALLHSLKKKNAYYKKLDGIIFIEDAKAVVRPVKSFRKNLGTLPFPAWGLFPIKNYWKLGYSHGPLSSGKYLPMLTSRGCVFGCKFCIAPELNKKCWRAKSPTAVVDEMRHWGTTYGVTEFHWEDLNPTIDKERIKKICSEILKRKLRMRWKLAAGSKIETVDEETIRMMAKAGCSYISFSPETGSKALLEQIGKPFNHELALKLVKVMNDEGIKSQACFVLGFPGETSDDIRQTAAYIRQLAEAGADEIALFIFTPIPGSESFGKIEGYKNLSELTFSPKWREDYGRLHFVRKRLYKIFLAEKLVHHPLKLMRQPFNILFRRFETKMEMTVYRALKMKWLCLSAGKHKHL